MLCPPTGLQDATPALEESATKTTTLQEVNEAHQRSGVRGMAPSQQQRSDYGFTSDCRLVRLASLPVVRRKQKAHPAMLEIWGQLLPRPERQARLNEPVEMVWCRRCLLEAAATGLNRSPQQQLPRG